MFYRRGATPKHRYNIIEEDYGGGGHRTRLRDQEINCCVYGAPPPPYIKVGGEGRTRGGGVRKGGVLLPVGIGLPPRVRHPLGRPPPPLLYIRGWGQPIDTTIDLLIS